MQTELTFDNLKRGDAIRITFGSKASQLAIVHDWTRDGNVRVWKFSAKRRVWKGPLRLYPGELMHAVQDRELRNCPPLPERYSELGRGYVRSPIRSVGAAA